MRKRNTSTSDFNNNRFPWGKMTPGIFQFQEFFSAYHCSGSLRDPSSHRSAPIWPSYNRCDTAECYKAVTRDTAICTQFPLEGTWHRKERSEQSFIVLSFSRKKEQGGTPRGFAALRWGWWASIQIQGLLFNRINQSDSAERI